MISKGILVLEFLSGVNYGCSSVGRALVSKTRCREFESLHPCKQVKRIKLAGIKNYIEEIVHELSNKVSWPTWKDLQTSSIIVLVTSIILALIIWLMDYIFGIWPVSDNASSFSWRGILGFIYHFINN